MAGPLYYIPKKKPPFAAKDAAEVGLGYAFEGAIGVCGTSHGPDNGQGIVIADDKTVPSVGYHKDRQTWRKVPGSVAWVGFCTDDPPKPEDLVRPDMLDGYYVPLGDGNAWLIPVALGPSESESGSPHTSHLPTKTVRDESGTWKKGDVLAPYGLLWEVACKWHDLAMPWLTGEGPKAVGRLADLDFQGANDAAVIALSANYRVSACEAEFLGLLTDRHTSVAVGAIIDLAETLRRLEKKTSGSGSEDSNTDAGQPGDTPDIDQP